MPPAGAKACVGDGCSKAAPADLNKLGKGGGSKGPDLFGQYEEEWTRIKDGQADLERIFITRKNISFGTRSLRRKNRSPIYGGRSQQQMADGCARWVRSKKRTYRQAKDAAAAARNVAEMQRVIPTPQSRSKDKSTTPFKDLGQYSASGAG